MAASLLKIVVSAVTTTDTETAPTSIRYVYTVDTDNIQDNVLTISSEDFYDDTGTKLTGNITTATEGNGYYQLYINGMIQQSGLYAVTASEVTVQEADSLVAGSYVVLVVTNFDPESTSTTIVTT